MRHVPLSFNGRTPGFDPGGDGSEPSDGASAFFILVSFLTARHRGGNIGLYMLLRSVAEAPSRFGVIRGSDRFTLKNKTLEE